MIDLFGIDPGKFNLKQEYFDHCSGMHGIAHTYRVMCNVLKLGSEMAYPHETKLAFFAAYIHDMARQHDKKCMDHGQLAAQFKLEKFIPLFVTNGMNPDDKPVIVTALANHCLREDLPAWNPHYITTAILKDADALDRVRISPDDLKLEFLRFAQSKELIGFAKAFYANTISKDISTFKGYLEIARIL